VIFSVTSDVATGIFISGVVIEIFSITSEISTKMISSVTSGIATEMISPLR
jgi:hypothetical protein